MAERKRTQRSETEERLLASAELVSSSGSIAQFVLPDRSVGQKNPPNSFSQKNAAFATNLERVKGIEPSSQAWEARILPLNHTR